MMPAFADNILYDPITHLPSCIGAGCAGLVNPQEKDTANVVTNEPKTSVVVYCTPSLQFNPPQVSGNQVSISDIVSDSSNGYIDWGDGVRTALTQDTHTYSNSGNYQIIVQVWNICNGHANGFSEAVDVLIYPQSSIQSGRLVTTQVQEVQDTNSSLVVWFLGIIGILVAFFSSIFGWKILGAFLTRPKVVKPLDPEDIVEVLRRNSKAAVRVQNLILHDPDLIPFSNNFVKEYESVRKALPRGFEEDNK